MICPHCKNPTTGEPLQMVLLFRNITTGEALWKCRLCGHKIKEEPDGRKEPEAVNTGNSSVR